MEVARREGQHVFCEDPKCEVMTLSEKWMLWFYEGGQEVNDIQILTGAKGNI